MARTHKTAHKSSGGYLPPQAAFAPQEDDVIIISDDEEEFPPVDLPSEEEETMMMEEEDVHGISEPVPPSPLPPSPTPAPVPTPVPSPVAQQAEDDEEKMWVVTLVYKMPPPAPHSFHHSLLVEMLQEYYADLDTNVSYLCTQYYHETEGTRWKATLIVTVADDLVGGHVVDTSHRSPCRRDSDLAAMEDAAQVAYEHYHGLRYQHMAGDRYRFLPRYHTEEGSWGMTAPDGLSPMATALYWYAHSMKMENGELKREAVINREDKKSNEKEIDSLRAQLGLPPKFKKVYGSYSNVGNHHH